MWARRGLRILLAVVAAIGVYAGYLVATANFHTVIAGTLYCSAQPSPEDIALWRQRYGIKTIVNLRGPNPAHDWYRNERAVARGLGIRLIDSRMSSKRETSATDVEELLALSTLPYSYIAEVEWIAPAWPRRSTWRASPEGRSSLPSSS